MAKSEEMKKFEEYMKTATIVISGDDFGTLTAGIMLEEPFKSCMKKDPSIHLLLMLYTARIIKKLISNPFKKDNESEEK